jgi:hypothetical protein
LRGLGYRVDTAAPRAGDLSFAAAHGHLLGVTLPDEDDHLVEHVRGILDQGQAEICVGASLAQNCQVMLSVEGEDPALPSASFIWYNARASLGDRDFNVGTFIYAGVDAVQDFGLPPDADWPLARAEWDFAVRPPMLAYEHAYPGRFGVELYRVGKTKDEVRAAIHGLGPITLGTQVTRAFTEAGPHSSPIGPPADGEEVAGGHAMSLVAYDEWGVRVPNTWGTGVGNDGWFYLSWDYVLSDVTSEIVVVKYVPKIAGAA